MANFEVFGGGGGGSGTFLPLAGGTMTGIVTLDGVDYSLTLVNDADYTPNANDQIIVYTAITTTRLVILTNLNVGQQIQVWDGTSGGSAAAHNINFSVSGSVQVNGTTNGQISAVTFSNGCATAVQTAANLWAAEAPPLPNLPYGAGQQTVSTQYKWTSPHVWNVGSTAPAITVGGGFQFTSNTQTISSTLNLAVGNPVVQVLTASGTDRAVVEASTGGIIRCVINPSAATYNLLVQIPSGTTVATVGPGHSVFYYINNTSPIFNVIAST